MRVPAITTDEVWQRVVELGVDDVHLLKLNCEGAEYTIVESLAESGRLPHVGWISGEWHGRRHRPRISDALSATHVYHVDPNPPHQCGLFIAIGGKPRERRAAERTEASGKLGDERAFAFKQLIAPMAVRSFFWPAFGSFRPA